MLRNRFRPLVLVAIIGGCSPGADEVASSASLPPELERLRAAWEDAASGGTGADAEVVAALTAILPDAEPPCPECRREVVWKGADGDGRIEIALTDDVGEVARMHLFFRPGLTAGALGAWASDEVGGFRAAAAERQLQVWPGRVEVRVLSARETEAAAEGLAGLAAALPLAELARL
ncbi:MAG: hypothetical protein R3190_02200 [Thermoanaerobaculia bacterium]|nr:hypothetical protein [Thermoanaerobaculia bacterium]